MAIDFAENRGIEPQHKADLVYNPFTPSQQALALQRLELKSMLNYRIGMFSFAKGYESITGAIQGIVKLSTQQEMLCIGEGSQSKLIKLEPLLQAYLGREAIIHLDKQGNIYHCEIKGTEADERIKSGNKTRKSIELIREGVRVEQEQIRKSSLSLSTFLSKQVEPTQTLEKNLTRENARSFEDGIGL